MLVPISLVLCCVVFPLLQKKGKMQVTSEKEKREIKIEKIEEKKPSGTAASFFSFMRVLPTLYMVTW